jgi:FkbM family methyltransferase
VTVEGIPMTADVTHFVFSGNYFGAVPYEAHLTRYFADHLRAGSVFVDVGANCGYFSLLAAGLTGASGRIFAFEPNPPVFDELSRHVQLNSVGDRVRMFKLALSDARVEGVPLFVSPLQSGLSTFITQRATSEQCFGRPGTVSVETVTFDEWREHESADHVDLMKIDVEGFEAQVLAGMIRSLRARRIRRIVCETTWDSPAHRLLVDAGFKPRFLENVGSVDNIAYELPGD